MENYILKSALPKNKNFFYLNKDIKEINNSDVKFIKKNFLDKDKYHLIIKKFGKVLKQDKFGKQFAEITPDIKKIKKKKTKKKDIKLRYHQTNTGGFIHSDGPQLNNPPKYVLMACNKNATRGGYSILSSIEKILLHLKKVIIYETLY